MPTDSTADQLHVREGYFPVAGAQLYFREVGNGGPPLVILHGGPDFNHNYLLPDLDRLSGTFHLIYYDQRGRGKSSRGVAPEVLNIKSEVDDLDRLRQHHDFVPLECVGNIAEAVFGSRLVVLSDCGHFAYLQRPTEVRNAIVHFLAQS